MAVKGAMLALCLLVAAVSTLADERVISHPTDAGLIEFLFKNRDLTSKNPQRSVECFDYYLPLLNQISNDFEKNYAACQRTAEEERARVDESTEEDRNDLEKSAASACDALTACTAFEASIPYLECYVQEGTNNAKSMFGISAHASQILSEVREQFHLIDNEEHRCTNASERQFLEESGTAYAELRNCLLGNSPLPTTTPPPSPTSTDTTPPQSTTDDTTPPPTDTTPPQSTTDDTTSQSTKDPVTIPDTSSTDESSESSSSPSSESTESTSSSSSESNSSDESQMPEEDLSQMRKAILKRFN